MLITRVSAQSGIERTIDLPITEEQYKNWESGELIQHAFPLLSADDREFIMTGIVSSEWDELFGEDE